VSKKNAVRTGSGNIFRDLGFGPAEANDLLARAELTRQIYNVIKDRDLSQSEAAEILGLKQPDVSLLMRGKFTRLSTDRLINLLAKLGKSIEIVIHEPRSAKNRGKITVIAA
jgi:predicted XRE-type DNA-binding protein